MYKVSLDRKTVVSVPEGTTLISFLKEKINAKKIVLDVFTSYDLQAGKSLKLIVVLNTARYTSVEIFAGKNLSKKDLK